jgi:hypothetical protein
MPDEYRNAAKGKRQPAAPADDPLALHGFYYKDLKSCHPN